MFPTIDVQFLHTGTADVEKGFFVTAMRWKYGSTRYISLFYSICYIIVEVSWSIMKSDVCNYFMVYEVSFNNTEYGYSMYDCYVEFIRISSY